MNPGNIQWLERFRPGVSNGVSDAARERMNMIETNTKKCILFVDDEPFILKSIRRSIKMQTDEWNLFFASSGMGALDMCDNISFDLIVTDAKMPQMEGHELLFRLRNRKDTCEIPTIMLTGFAEESLRKRAVEAGVIEFLNKPIDTEELVLRLRNVIRLKTISDELRQKNEELKESSKQIIRRLGKAAEYRDNETGKHVIRVAYYCRILAEGLGLESDLVDLISMTTPMHDIGKIGIPDDILKKKDKLKPIEYEIIKKHALFGGEVLQPLTSDELGYYNQHMAIGRDILAEQNTPLLSMAASIAFSHHEKWDGTGYPAGLKGEAIPLEGRIVAVADVFDALTSKRYYKPAYPLPESIAIINEMNGTHFEPALVDCFNENIDKIIEVVHHLSDNSKSDNPEKNVGTLPIGNI